MSAEALVEKHFTWTEQDFQQQRRSVMWFHRQRDAGKLWDFTGNYVAIKGEEIIDADPDEQTLIKRLEAKYKPGSNIVIQSMHPIPNWK